MKAPHQRATDGRRMAAAPGGSGKAGRPVNTGCGILDSGSTAPAKRHERGAQRHPCCRIATPVVHILR
ncbi:TPA: hypothetical protein G9F10_004086 [Salmonella enterica]|nr:hypothetical protein [Salmonella enterica]